MALTIPAGFPDARTTGVPAGTVLTAYTGPKTISTDGTVIENKIINGSLAITGDNVIIRNCRIVYDDFFGIDIRTGINIRIENCDIVGPGDNGDSAAAINADVGGGTFIGNDISGAEHGIVLGPGSSVVVGNYIHDGGSDKADPHIGGISVKGGQNNVLIEGNTVIGGSDATSDLFIQNTWGPITNVRVNHNYFGGDPGYNIYVEGRFDSGPVTGISITNNVISKGHYGPYSIVDASPTLSGNVELAPGTTIPSDPTPTDPTPSDPTPPSLPPANGPAPGGGAATPGAPTITSFSNDSGRAGDHITSDNTLTLTGTAAASSIVKVFDGTTQLGTATTNANGAWTFTTNPLADGSHSLTATTATTTVPGTSPLIFEDFNPWNGNTSPDGIWRVAGTWTGTGGNTLQPGNVSFTNTYPGETNTGFMHLTVPAGSPLRGAELQSMTTPGYSYGYYEVRMKPANVHNGGVASFFWIEQPGYGPHEWDVEFTLSDSWAGGSGSTGRVSFSTHPVPGSDATWVNLPYHPSQAFHNYGFLWTPGRIDFTVDAKIVHTMIDPSLNTEAKGYIMMNGWSGSSNFGGGPPSQNATSVYDWVKFYPGATSIPTAGAERPAVRRPRCRWRSEHRRLRRSRRRLRSTQGIGSAVKATNPTMATGPGYQ